jgi:hypothetical protein
MSTMRDAVARAVRDTYYPGTHGQNNPKTGYHQTYLELADSAITACLEFVAAEADAVCDDDDSCVDHPIHGWMTVPDFIRSFLPSQTEVTSE